MSLADAVRPSALAIVAVLALALPRPALAQEADAEATPSEESAPARAEPRLGRSSTVLTPSAIASYGAGIDDEFGAGLQLRLDHYPTQYAIRFGGFVQGEVMTDGSVRLAGGLANAMWLFGCEIGIAYRTDTGHYASSVGLHIGKSILLGPVTIGGRMTIPLADFPSGQDGDSRRVMGLEGQVVLSVGLPTTLDGPERRAFDCGRGHGHGSDDEGSDTDVEE